MADKFFNIDLGTSASQRNTSDVVSKRLNNRIEELSHALLFIIASLVVLRGESFQNIENTSYQYLAIHYAEKTFVLLLSAAYFSAAIQTLAQFTMDERLCAWKYRTICALAMLVACTKMAIHGMRVWQFSNSKSHTALVIVSSTLRAFSTQLSILVVAVIAWMQKRGAMSALRFKYFTMLWYTNASLFAIANIAIYIALVSGNRAILEKPGYINAEYATASIVLRSLQLVWFAACCVMALNKPGASVLLRYNERIEMFFSFFIFIDSVVLRSGDTEIQLLFCIVGFVLLQNIRIHNTYQSTQRSIDSSPLPGDIESGHVVNISTCNLDCNVYPLDDITMIEEELYVRYVTDPYL